MVRVEDIRCRVIRWGYKYFPFGPQRGENRYFYIASLVNQHLEYFLSKIWCNSRYRDDTEKLIRAFWKYMELLREEYDRKLAAIGEF
jgi:hypothetical protein